MAIRYHIFPEHRLVYVVGTGTLTFGELSDHLVELKDNPAYVPPMGKLIDYRKVLSVELNYAELQRFSKIKERLSESFLGERSVIVTDTDLVFGLARQHQNLMGDGELEVFVCRTIGEAIQWLGVNVTESDLADPIETGAPLE